MYKRVSHYRWPANAVAGSVAVGCQPAPKAILDTAALVNGGNHNANNNDDDDDDYNVYVAAHSDDVTIKGRPNWGK